MLPALNNLQKFIKLEHERGYDNKAIVGGFEKILPTWTAQAHKDALSDQQIELVTRTLERYKDLTPVERRAALDNLFDLVKPRDPAHTGDQTSSEDIPIPASTNQQIAVEDQAPAPVLKPAGISTSLTVIKGIGERNASALAKLGLRTLEDLVLYYPRRYDDYSQLKPINHLFYGDEVTVIGSLKAINTRPIRNGKFKLTEALLNDGTGSLRLTWFNQPWIANNFKSGAQVVVSGKLDQYLGRLVMNSPEIEEIERDHLHTNRIVPVYPLTAGISQKMLRRWIYQAVSYWAPRLPDFLPESIRSAVKLIDLRSAVLQVHFPESQDMLDLARWRLAFDEIFLLQLGVMRQKRAWQSVKGRVFQESESWRNAFHGRLPFPLTGAQQRAIDDIKRDLCSGKPMERLLQGDVGSGKTIVAAAAATLVMRAGAQASIMAPTSILAEQHHHSLTRLLCETGEHGAPLLAPEQIRLLIGDTPNSEKSAIRTGLANGEIKLVIGTHALIEDPIVFHDLQLVVIDEQHRFGVEQRSMLRAKGSNPHLLVMTATPIPRSLALTVYGDLDLSVIDEMPPGRLPVRTQIIHPRERERAYQLVRNEINAGNQAFIIYPLVEESEKDEGLAAVEDHERLQKIVFPDLKLGLMHGRLKPDEKENVMRRFRDREFDILVSTSVVEVGVDIPRATIMIIEGANRFGLAQLHQFRGRVGRGNQPSTCLLVPDHEDAIEVQRLMVMAETNDGFVLAERDLEQRGPGDFLGTRQAGFSELRMAKLTDVRLIERARVQAQRLFAVDPDLSQPQHAALLNKLNQFWTPGQGDIS